MTWQDRQIATWKSLLEHRDRTIRGMAEQLRNRQAREEDPRYIPPEMRRSA